MDPDVCWGLLLSAVRDGDGEGVSECAELLITWILKGGFVPRALKEEGYDRNATLHTLRLVRRVAQCYTA